jgi:hypothetical protein
MKLPGEAEPFGPGVEVGGSCAVSVAESWADKVANEISGVAIESGADGCVDRTDAVADIRLGEAVIGVEVNTTDGTRVGVPHAARTSIEATSHDW